MSVFLSSSGSISVVVVSVVVPGLGVDGVDGVAGVSHSMI